MMFTAFGEENYKLALRDYLNKTSYGTARPTDLWKSFEPYVSISINSRNVTIEEVMESWTNQPGYPVVHAILNNKILEIHQVIKYSFMSGFLNILFEYILILSLKI